MFWRAKNIMAALTLSWMGQPSFYHATVALSFQIEICNLGRTKSSFVATSLLKNNFLQTFSYKVLSLHCWGLLHKTFYRRKLWLKLKTRVSTILPLTLTQEKTQVKNNLSFLRLRVLCNRPLMYCIYCISCYFREGFIFANFASQTLAKISTSIHVYL